jgi:ADP-ribose pyrophosphatase YjhB (NUDIX family)
VTCTRCGTSHWRNPKPCANAVVIADGKIVLVKRAYRESPWFGTWCAPGGFCEVGEHPAETAVREAREEAGLDVEITGYLGTWVDVYADDPDDREAEVINVAYYTAALASDEHAGFDPAEVSEVEWFAWDELPTDLSPPGTLESVLAAARTAATTPERSRPR